MTAHFYRLILFCKSIELLKQFYSSSFDFALKEETPGQWVVLQSGGLELALHRIGEAYDTEEPFRVETNAKLVFSVSDIQQTREALLSSGAEMGAIRSFEGYPFLYCDGTDPEGNVIQLEQAVGPDFKVIQP